MRILPVTRGGRSTVDYRVCPRCTHATPMPYPYCARCGQLLSGVTTSPGGSAVPEDPEATTRFDPRSAAPAGLPAATPPSALPAAQRAAEYDRVAERARTGPGRSGGLGGPGGLGGLGGPGGSPAPVDMEQTTTLAGRLLGARAAPPRPQPRSRTWLAVLLLVLAVAVVLGGTTALALFAGEEFSRFVREIVSGVGAEPAGP